MNYHSVHPTHHNATTPDDFETQMEYLKSEFTVISLVDFQTLRQSDSDLPDKVAVITFDDGYEDNYQYAFPILKKLELPATIFVSTAYIDGDVDITQRYFTYRGLTPLTWDQIREMKQSRISFGGHTDSHQILSEILIDDAKREIILSKSKLEARLGEPVTHFAYPLGQPWTFNPAIIDILRESGFSLSCATIWGSDNSHTDMFALHRIRIDAVDTVMDFKNKVLGKWDFTSIFQTIKARWS